MARKAAYTGGAWSIGACRPHPRPQTAREAAQRAQAVRSHYLPYAERQAATGRPWWAGIVQFYRHELAQLDAITAGVANATPEQVAGKDVQKATVDTSTGEHSPVATVTGKDGQPRPAQRQEASIA